MNFDYKRLVKFEHNVGEQEKKYRLYAGAGLVVIAIFTASIALLIAGLIFTATGFTGWSPIYSAIGKNTNDAESTPIAAEEEAEEAGEN